MPTAQYTLRNFGRFLLNIPYFFYWWYIHQTIFWMTFIWRTLLLIADGISIGPMLKSLFSPYHQDRTFVGYFMGFLLRVLWLIIGSVIWIISFGILLFLLPLHLMWPFGFYFGMAFATYFDLPWQQTFTVALGWLITFSSVYYYSKKYVIMPKLTVDKLDLSGDIDFEKLEDSFMPRLKHDWNKALKLASNEENLEDLSYYLFLSATINRRNLPIFYRLNLHPKKVYEKAKEREYNLKSSIIPLSDLVRKMVDEAKKLGHNHLDSDVLLAMLVHHNRAVHDLFVDMGVTTDEIEQATLWIYEMIKKRNAWKYWLQPHFKVRGGYDRAWTSAWTPTLRRVSQNVTKLVSEGRIPKMVGRKKEIEQVMRILTRTTKNNVLLIGSAGVGKTALVYGIAQQMLTGEALELKDKKLVQVDFPALVANTGPRGDFESKFKKILEESGPGKTILFLDEIATVMHAGGGEGTVDAATVLLPYLSAGSIQCIGATDYIDYRKSVESNSTFASFFQVVEVKEPSLEETMTILENFSDQIEQQQGVTITLQAIEAAVKLSKQYIRDRLLPEKAIDILDETATAVRRKNKRYVTHEDVAEVISLKTGVPVTHLTEPEKDKLLHLENHLHKKIIGQDEAITVIANAMRRARVGLKDETKPVARFLFLGPTGVGKTETCKALAQMYYGSENSMIRLDMSEYQDAGSLTRMIGADPGTKDYEAGGQLTDAIRRKPFSLVLLDELEKAHPRILDVFLQVLDDGRLTDSSGRVVSFQDSIIIATSNAQAVMIQDAVKKGVSQDQLKEMVINNLNQTFRPEFINRFDAVVVYNPLSMEQVLQIAVILLESVRDMLKKKEIGFEITPEALLSLAKQGFNPQFGARPLKRVIQDKVENKIAQKILEGNIKEGDIIRIEESDVV